MLALENEIFIKTLDLFIGLIKCVSSNLCPFEVVYTLPAKIPWWMGQSVLALP